ncbi:MAG TPA: hydroxymethylbilane synthase, partial [Urbifossiella sp.]|nr:hydroxymethylbilane synthase [Urbifossiella sp.]
AVHSAKDMSTTLPPGLGIAAVLPREDPRDVFVSRKAKSLQELPPGAVVGTASLRRQAMVKRLRPDVSVVPLRGNVETRLRKLEENDLDAIILAEAGLVRLGLADRVTEVLDATWMLPAVGQGAIGLECRSDDADTIDAVLALTDADTFARVTAERAMLAALGGGCLVPIGTTSSIDGGTLTIRGMVLTPDGRRKVSATHAGPADAPLATGQELAAMLLAEGAGELLT